MEQADYLERLKNTGRNDQCPCGSGKKYKKCHMDEDEQKRHEESAKQEELRAAEAADEETQEEAPQKKKAQKTQRPGQGANYRGGKGSRTQSLPRRSAI